MFHCLGTNTIMADVKLCGYAPYFDYLAYMDVDQRSKRNLAIDTKLMTCNAILIYLRRDFFPFFSVLWCPFERGELRILELRTYRVREGRSIKKKMKK